MDFTSIVRMFDFIEKIWKIECALHIFILSSSNIFVVLYYIIMIFTEGKTLQLLEALEDVFFFNPLIYGQD